ncbi:MAG: hypothetical protein D6693_04560 [Planctomycetota bacterium]|nr:MAG: hypothetical protein D6693_04560 [Planctomycetota bacterium]
MYRRALHPELFSIKGRRVIEHGAYEFEAWIMPGQHVMRFQYGDLNATEVLTGGDVMLPQRGLAAAIPCPGERDFEQPCSDDVTYMTSIQTETLPENLYAATFEELTEFGEEVGALMHFWDDATGPCVSILDTQRLRTEVHAQAYHLLAQGGVVIRTQSLFEHKAKPETAASGS